MLREYSDHYTVKKKQEFKSFIPIRAWESYGKTRKIFRCHKHL